MVVSVDPSNLNAFASVNNGAAGVFAAASSAHSATMFNGAVEAVGPIGPTYFAAYGPAQPNDLFRTLLDGEVHAAIGEATEAVNSSFTANDA